MDKLYILISSLGDSIEPSARSNASSLCNRISHQEKKVHTPLNTLFIVSTRSLTPSSADQTDSICPENTMCPVIMLMVLVSTPCCRSLMGKASSHHYTPLLLEMKPTAPKQGLPHPLSDSLNGLT